MLSCAHFCNYVPEAEVAVKLLVEADQPHPRARRQLSESRYSLSLGKRHDLDVQVVVVPSAFHPPYAYMRNSELAPWTEFLDVTLDRCAPRASTIPWAPQYRRFAALLALAHPRMRDIVVVVFHAAGDEAQVRHGDVIVLVDAVIALLALSVADGTVFMLGRRQSRNCRELWDVTHVLVVVQWRRSPIALILRNVVKYARDTHAPRVTLLGRCSMLVEDVPGWRQRRGGHSANGKSVVLSSLVVGCP